MNIPIISFILGCISGYGYGILFLLQRKSLFKPGYSPQKHIVSSIISTAARIISLSLLISSILLYSTIQPILFSSGFLCTFWLTILYSKASIYEKY